MHAPPETERPTATGRWVTGLRWGGDATALLLLVGVVWWLSFRDGGHPSVPLAYVGIVGVLAASMSADVIRTLPRTARGLLGSWLGALVIAMAFAADRTELPQTLITASLLPVVALSAYRIWNRRWGPAALFAVLGLGFGQYWYRSFLQWWGFALTEGHNLDWRPLTWHNPSGALMAGFGLLFAGLALTSRRVVAVAGGLMCAGALAGVWLTGSRGSVVVAIIGLTVLAIGAVRQRGWLRSATALSATVATAAVIVVGLHSMAPGRSSSADGNRTASAVVEGRSLEGGAAATRNDAATNLLVRFDHWEAAWGMFLDRPLTGQGLGSYRRMAQPWTPPDSILTSSAHNEYLEALAEGGLPYALALGATVIAGVVLAWRRVSAAVPSGPVGDIEMADLRWPLSLGAAGVVFALAIHQGGDFDWEYPVVPALLAVAIGMLIPHGGSGQARRAARRWSTTAIAGVMAVLLVVGAGGTIWQWQANEAQPDLDAEELARVPVAWDGSRAINVATVLSDADRFGLAGDVLDRAIRWNPGYERLHAERDIVLYLAGDLEASELVDRLQDRPHTSMFSYHRVAETLVDEGQPSSAVPVLEALVRTYPRYRSWGIEGLAQATWRLLAVANATAEGCDAADATARRAEVEADIPAELIREAVAEVCPES